MASSKRLKANELVTLLSGLLNLDVELMARVGNLPARNLRSWLSGKKENLRLQSVMNLMSILGLKLEGGIRLDDSRVHYWNISDGFFTRGKTAYQSLVALSKLLSGGMITAVRPLKPSLADKFTRSYFLVSGNGVRVVICVSKSIFKKAKINPEVIKGACWRDDNDHHVINANDRLWTNMVECDLTVFEFDSIFNQIEETVNWGDVSLMAREFGVTPANVSQWIMDTYGENAPQHDSDSETEGGDSGIDIEGGGKLLLLVNNNRRTA